MKKNIIEFSLIIVLVVLCTACNGDVTRDIRHSGFTVGNKFICKDFISNKGITSNRIKYMTNSHIIDEDGKIYEISIAQKYANEENCKEVNTKVKVKAIFDDKIVKGIDDKYYYLVGENEVASYSEVPNTDNSYEIYDMLLKDKDVVKVVTANSSTGLYYVLKTDGNVYTNTIVKENNNYEIQGIKIVYDKSKYGSKIIDFNYAGNSLNTYIKTEDKIYRMKITNYKKCTKYADVMCKYSLVEDKTLNKYKNKIVIYNGSLLITDYNQVFNVSE